MADVRIWCELAREENIRPELGEADEIPLSESPVGFGAELAALILVLDALVPVYKGRRSMLDGTELAVGGENIHRVVLVPGESIGEVFPDVRLGREQRRMFSVEDGPHLIEVPVGHVDVIREVFGPLEVVHESVVPGAPRSLDRTVVLSPSAGTRIESCVRRSHAFEGSRRLYAMALLGERVNLR